MELTLALKKIADHIDLSREESRGLFTRIMNGTESSIQIAAVLTALRMKGETINEITGAVEVMREKVTAIFPNSHHNMVDTCGTGGDGAHTFNISTAAALVAAGAGAQVAKHGNRAVSSSSGSADVLEVLGVKVGIPPETMTRCLNDAGIAFLFAPALHPAMKHAMPVRKELGIRTIFNILGPLTNPAGAPAQVIGVYSAKLVEIVAGVLANLGSHHAYVVHGLEGLDEVSICGPTTVAKVYHGKIASISSVTPEDHGLTTMPLTSIAGGSPVENAAIIKSVLNGTLGAPREIVVLNAAYALHAAGVSSSIEQGIAAAREAIDSGKALGVLEKLAKLTND